MDVIEEKNDINGVVGNLATDGVNEDRKTCEPLVRGIRKKNSAKIVVITALILLFWISGLQLATSERYQTKIKVANSESLTSSSTDKKILDYGSLAKGSSSMRFISVTNKGSHGAYIKVIKIGAAAKIMRIEESAFELGAGGNKDVQVAVQVPGKTDKSEYDGAIIILKFPKIF
jgi:hypothetical protein